MQNIEPSINNNTPKVLHVCVAVIGRYNTESRKKEVLIAKRPDHVHQGGLWEFPGGKVESDEKVLDALSRELFEELDIRINTSSDKQKYSAHQKLIQIKHSYPDKIVFLDVWRIQDFTRNPIGKEGQNIRWIEIDDLGQYSFPAANKAIITACLLPNKYFITPAYSSLIEAEKSLGSALSKKAELIYFRQPQLNRDQYDSWVEVLLSKMPALSERLVYQFSETLEKYSGAGLHLSQRLSHSLKARPINHDHWFAVSCHNQAEIDQATNLGADFITLSPVLPTMTHPDHDCLGWSKFKGLVLNAGIPVYGLGGLSKDDELVLIDTGAQGIAGISFWQPSK